MESDDDFQSFSSPFPPSPSQHLRKLRRLKKKSTKVSADPRPVKLMDDDLIPLPSVDFAKLEALEASAGVGFDDSEEQLPSQLMSEGFDNGNGERWFHGDHGETEGALGLEDEMADERGGDREGLNEKIADLKIDKAEKKWGSEGGSDDKEEKKKRVESILQLPSVDFAKLEALESSKTLDLDDSNESLQSQSPSDSFNDANETHFGDEEPRETRRVLEFDDDAGEFGGQKVEEDENIADLRVKKSDRKRINDGGLDEKKEKKKKVKSDSNGTKSNTSNKRREDKERKFHLQQLHAESQRLLRETRGAGFKPVPVVQKPLSSILEKIRQRKLEVSKKISYLNSSAAIAESNDCVKEVMMDIDSEKVTNQGGAVDTSDRVQEETNTAKSHEISESGLDASSVDRIKECETQLSIEHDKSNTALVEECTPAFRPPLNDTQDLFGESQTSDGLNDQPEELHNTPSEEVLAPSLLTMNLKFDCAPPDDDISSDEEDNDKENFDPLKHRPGDGCISPEGDGDPVKDFVDDEAEEEDDSDNDIRLQENEDEEGNEDSEELDDLIVTGYEEKSTDHERRNELHQKWLEQQDAVGTDTLMQKLRCGPKIKEKNLYEVEDESDEDEEGFSDDENNLEPAKLTQINTKKAKQMITQMLVDKDDAYLSDDDETEKKLVKQRALDKAGDQTTLVSPAEDEDSREVFGLIKKLNSTPVTKKKAKPSSFFDMLLTGGNSSSKSSFLGRMSNHSLPSSNKQRSNMARSFIFGRDDSNSRSSISTSDDSSDAVAVENRSTRNVSAKFSSSQFRSMTQSTKVAAETASGTSLFEILKLSSMQSNSCNQDSMVGLTQTVFSAFKIPKKPIKIEGRTKF